MTQRETMSFAALARQVGRAFPPSDWLLVDQAMISGFGGVTGDDAFIHVDPVRAARTRFGGTIAHGLLTLSLLPLLARTSLPEISDRRMAVNYGFDRVRFVAPVKVGSRVRGHFVLASIAEDKPGFHLLSYDVKVEIENHPQPAASARWLLGLWIA